MFDDHRQRLADAMSVRGAWPARSPWTRQAVDALARHAFAPDRLWHWDGHAYVPVVRGTDPDRWAAEVYAGPDDAAVTRLADGHPSSSLSCQAVVVDMLDALLLDPGHRVLELGTGTGWNAALLGWRAGPGHVVSVEVDRELAAEARRRLDDVRAGVTVEIGDGSAGWPGGAPYDRVISTYAVDTVPWAWIAQTRPGGRIVTPWGRLGHVALTVAADGRSATGWVQGLATFMPARGTGAPSREYRDVRGTGDPDDERPARDMGPLHTDWNLRFAVRVALPEVRVRTAADADGTNVWLHDGEASWAMCAAVGDGRTVAYQGGPRRLADEVVRVWDWWSAEDEPSVYDWGMTVEPSRQTVWCRDPATSPRWRLAGPSDPLPASA
ncbi:methyltransferase domain-containing protein [Streptomyces sp. B1866]|uniref:methyltransferase domain-containing protein n=1 Tax=Streptomyces sp. B1866 TaxID=3075431 RepID=UPI00288E1A7A|nr:methyltransferase domain-containing protein [Streptomyces sp. B1866]MDT3398489.1 methyltransferase domain-containing protein [Streptomyces sp. B1866]